jgi:hypothetical protein
MRLLASASQPGGRQRGPLTRRPPGERGRRSGWPGLAIAAVDEDVPPAVVQRARILAMGRMRRS